MENTAKKISSHTVVDIFEKFEHFSKVMIDAYVLVDADGRILKSNLLFSQLVGQKIKQILKASSFDDLITMEVNDRQIHIKDLLEYLTPTRIDEVRGRNKQLIDLNMIVSVYPFSSEDSNTGNIGAFILLRDVTAETQLQNKYKDKAIQSITDPLTELFTRTYFEDYLELQVKTRSVRSYRENEEADLSILMVDIDFFKKVNDTYGHQAGDYILKSLADIMRRVFRKTDVCCRYGGEEFLIILPDANLKNAALASDKLRKATEIEHIVFDGIHIPITISCGVAAINFPNETYMETVARADAALYQSKKDGRNRVSIHDGSGIKIGPSVKK